MAPQKMHPPAVEPIHTREAPRQPHDFVLLEGGEQGVIAEINVALLVG